MNANLSKPKHHNLPRLWMHVADTLRLARRFEVPLNMTLDEVVSIVQSMDQVVSSEKFTSYTEINTSPKSVTFTMKWIEHPNKELAYLEGELREEPDLFITTISGKVYPGTAFMLASMMFALTIPVFFIILLNTHQTGAILLIVAIVSAIALVELINTRNQLLDNFKYHLEQAKKRAQRNKRSKGYV
jgi:hypothetical protein